VDDLVATVLADESRCDGGDVEALDGHERTIRFTRQADG
jgi:hypothetical protein